MPHRRQAQTVSNTDSGYGGSEEEELIDTTERLALHSRKLDRQQRKGRKRAEKAAAKRGQAALHLLPVELILDIISYLKPSDVFTVASTCKSLRDQVIMWREVIANSIIDHRFTNLARSFPRPKRLAEVDEKYHSALQSELRQQKLQIHRRPYQHIQSHEPNKLCSCLTCVLLWNNLCLIVDFHHWQARLDDRSIKQPITPIPRGENPEWNTKLVYRNSLIVRRALKDSLWYARILEAHLDTIVRTMRRWQRYPRDQSKPDYKMTKEEAASGIDAFLGRRGQQTIEFPYRRDVYFHLEAYMPNRRWDHEKQAWRYVYAGSHERDCEWVLENHMDLKLPLGCRIRDSAPGPACTLGEAVQLS